MLYETLKWHQIAFTCKGGDGYVAIFPGEILLYSHFPPDKEGGKMAIQPFSREERWLGGKWLQNTGMVTHVLYGFFYSSICEMILCTPNIHFVYQQLVHFPLRLTKGLTFNITLEYLLININGDIIIKLIFFTSSIF